MAGCGRAAEDQPADSHHSPHPSEILESPRLFSLRRRSRLAAIKNAGARRRCLPAAPPPGHLNDHWAAPLSIWACDLPSRKGTPAFNYGDRRGAVGTGGDGRALYEVSLALEAHDQTQPWKWDVRRGFLCWGPRRAWPRVTPDLGVAFLEGLRGTHF